MQTDIHAEELDESEKHDVLFKAVRGTRVFKPDEWERFDRIVDPVDGYIYSVQLLGDLRGRRVLDFGCGDGWLSVLLAKRGAHVCAFDISAEAVRVGTELAEANGVGDQIDFKVASGYETGYQDGEFDLVIGQAILHHMDDKARLAAELARIMRRGGKAVFFECFGNSILMERLRLLVPVRVDDHDEDGWKRQIKYRDLDAFRPHFKVTYREFQLLSRLDRLFGSDAAKKFLGRLDVILLRAFPFFRSLARTIVISMER